VLLAGMVAGVGCLLGRPIGVHPVIGAWPAIRGALWRSEVGDALSEAERILADRFIRGEIDEDGYRRRTAVLHSGR
jgi:uncharacterized membrane protein